MFNNENYFEGKNTALKAGDKHYRAYVGPPEQYDLISAMVFNLLTTMGLRQTHKVLDIGCGSLRVGRLLIPYLNKNNYTGVEPNKWFIEDGIKKEVGNDLIKMKQPVFSFKNDLSDFNNPLEIDFAVAQSVFSHTGPNLLEKWLHETAFHLKNNGALFATFIPDVTDCDIKGWIYPGCVKFTPGTLEKMANKAGLNFKIIDWAHPPQTWAIFYKNNYDTILIRNSVISWNDMFESLKLKKGANK